MPSARRGALKMEAELEKRRFDVEERKWGDQGLAHLFTDSD
jgi:hypothetical protein